MKPHALKFVIPAKKRSAAEPEQTGDGAWR
jgi:hypothetical protein